MHTLGLAFLLEQPVLTRAQAFPGGVLCLLEGVEGAGGLVQVSVRDDVEARLLVILGGLGGVPYDSADVPLGVPAVLRLDDPDGQEVGQPAAVELAGSFAGGRRCRVQIGQRADLGGQPQAGCAAVGDVEPRPRSLLFLLRFLLSALGARRPALLRALCLLLGPEGLAGSSGHGVA